VVMDISLPGQSGIATVARLRQRLPECGLLIFSMHTHPSYATQAFEAGALGYVTKASPADELVTAIREVAQHRRYLSTELAHALAWEQLGHERAALANLSPREFEVLRMLVGGQSVEVIANALHLSPKTVMNLHYAIKRKLEVDTDIELVRLAMRLDLPEVSGLKGSE
jgi:two-component system, NarL family, invasion response regulator UvrY